MFRGQPEDVSQDAERRILQRIEQLEETINRKLDRIMAAQDDINEAVAQVGALLSDIAAQVAQLGSDVTAIQGELANIPAEVDTSALNELVASIASTQASLDSAVSSATGLVPPAPAS